ncbi:Phospholipase D1 [Holothuria leucospilota]|uniref:Phospholipase n=1 Tax=Holothuria leucospilota TaxID=206669 RepID=A0A9Q1H4D2_HOLLE|nr:Phospholipase D1 [Holothuria leucospilota]
MSKEGEQSHGFEQKPAPIKGIHSGGDVELQDINRNKHAVVRNGDSNSEGKKKSAVFIKMDNEGEGVMVKDKSERSDASVGKQVNIESVKDTEQKESSETVKKSDDDHPATDSTSEEVHSLKGKKRLKKQLSVRFAEDDPKQAPSPLSEIYPDAGRLYERREPFSRTKTVREHIRSGLMRVLHPDSYESDDGFQLDQGVQSYDTFDWDSATPIRGRTASFGESLADSVSSPPPLQRLGSVISTLSQDEVDLYRKQKSHPLNRMESVVSTVSVESDGLSESSRNYLNFGTEDAKGHPYKMVYSKPKPFHHKLRLPFVEEEKIYVSISDIGRVSGERSLNPNLYFIEIHHGSCIWTVRRRYHHFLKVYQDIYLYMAALSIPFGDHHHRERSRAYREKSHKRLPHFPRTPDALVRSRDMAKRMIQLQKYLQAVLNNPVLRNHPTVLEFFEVSELSFIDELGLKAKEGWVMKKSGGRHVPSGICSCCPSCKMKARYSKRWLITKDSFVAYVRHTDGTVRTVMLFDRSFEARCGKDETGRSSCLIVSNQHRTLRVRCTSKLAAREWMVEILKAAEKCDYSKSHPCGSFAPLRFNNFAHWFADGELYFQSVADALEAAQEEILISDWWFNPDIYLKRPAVEGHKWKVDELLKRKAIEGVKIFILLYKEVELALGLDSKRTKAKLQSIHHNIRVLRHPNHPPGGIILWAHHEKVVIVDQAVAFLGGLDICYGRWDDFKHRLTDLGSVTHTDRTLERQKKNMVTTTSLVTQHDLSTDCTPPVIPKQKSLPAMLPSLKVQSAPVERMHVGDGDTPASRRRDERESLHRQDSVMESDEGEDIASSEGPSIDPLEKEESEGPSTSTLEQEDGEVSSSGKSNHTTDDLVVPVTVVEERLATLGVKGKARLWPGKDYCNFVARDVIQPHLAFQDSVDRSSTPRMPWHDISAVVYGNAARDVARHFIERWNSTKEEKFKQDPSYPLLMPKSNRFHPPLNLERVLGTTKCTCQILRSVDHWSAGVKDKEDSIHKAYLKVIHEAKHYIYIENQFFISIANSNDVFNGIAQALYERIVRAHRNNETFRVYIVQPLLPSFQGEVGSDSGKSIHAILHWEYRSICRGKDSLLERLKASGIHYPQQYITFNGLRNWGELAGELVSELVYIHSKLLIADDNTVIIGSANINDRSLLGSRDSEIAVLVQDTETVDSVMNGKMYQAGVFASGLRQRLFNEHLGILQGRWKQDVSDPVSESFFKGVWILTASNNTANFEKVFHCAPTNSARTFQQLKQYRETKSLASSDKQKALKILKNIRGYLVFFPLDFLSEEALQPSITTQEGIAPTKLWT